MLPFFKKRLRCFYCGLRSSQPHKEGIRQWQCQQCLAVNYLDENNEITDPPVSAASSGPRYAQYAQPLPRSDSQGFTSSQSSDSSIFCSTCIKNQQILTQTLASYLPPQSHPDYDQYEASYPAYRKSLEERYPQVCGNCEPRVRNRIRQAGYAAKSDHLRRMMEKSRGGRSNRRGQGFGWRSVLVSVGALSFWASIAGQLAWNLMGAMVMGREAEDVEVDLSFSLVPLCFDQVLRRQTVLNGCPLVLAPYAGFALFLGILSIWWNPKLRDKAEGRGGRLTGMGEYYKVQIVVLAVRFVAWACLQDPSITGLNPGLAPAIHAFMGAFTIISVLVSRRVIRFDTRPLVTWQDNIEPLVPPKPKESLATQSQLPTPPDSQASFSTSGVGSQRFPINSLAPSPLPAQPESYIPPPPETVDDADAMDWTPSQETQILQPNPPRRLPLHEATGPSPFQGQLPPAPKPPSWQLRNPSPEPVSRAPQHKPNPFHSAPILQPNNASRGSQPTSSMDNIMAPPKFFPPSDFATDTGLESLFDKAFSIKDNPLEGGKQRRDSKPNSGASGASTTRSSRILKCVLLTISIFVLLAAQLFELPGNFVETIVLGISFLVAGFSLLESLMKPLAAWSAVDIILSVVELIACVYLATYPSQGPYDRYKFDRAGKCLVAFMAGQEMIALGLPSARKPTPSRKNTTNRPPQKDEPPAPPATHTSHLQLQRYEEPLKKEPIRPSFTNQNRLPSPTRTYPNNFRLNASFSSGASVNTQHHIPSPLNTPLTLSNTPSLSNYNPLNDPTATHPAPFSSILRPQPPLNSSFLSSSFNSAALPDHLFSPPSTTTASTSYASSTASEPPTPPQKYASLAPVSGRRIPSPGIGGLSLDDSPQPPRVQAQTQTEAKRQVQSREQGQQVQGRSNPRYALRARR
ncbi:hypothetical protein FQN55_002324 [Onygenales sp. PD_40]|nr:hypothetical protein FQN55_002324 [Onygenales sp. PD_40]KAK2781893.1 hypothetical protein FQN52_001293 [Onygenales sp. PD_12]KAK2783695.1 hypothetical protein FQN53_009017 [Emmonsiellopsis sp. PD_33]